MKKVLQIVLGLVILGLAYYFYRQIMTPLEFQKDRAEREAEVIKRIKDIRSAEQAYKQVYAAYCDNMDSLLKFVLNDSLTMDRTIGSFDDSIAVAEGRVTTEKFRVAVKDTIFTTKLTDEEIMQLAFIPNGKDGAKYILAADFFETESGVTVPVFECKAPYKDFLHDLDKQELINLIDERKGLNKYPGIKVGALDQATNDAGNWE